ncbi:hypothetical protein HYALB_00005361 [Hymenoscyphus albidus]|uniref:Protein kinase domain-containing protein n=1 Tax=Hymenoscyphus albidus TaxID=595503 RepID=A0A9N9LHC1_9HELO|nr:hypothetical protein HYALB_00005361 [Hymenoscyphus albidus]
MAQRADTSLKLASPIMEGARHTDEGAQTDIATTSDREERAENYLPDAIITEIEDGVEMGVAEDEEFVRKYLPPDSDNVEDVERYQLGGYHPVSLGDILGGYEIVHKLGFGGFSTVWLGWDVSNKTYAAIKINTADATVNSDDDIFKHILEKGADQPALKYIERPIRYFTVSGPNGCHLCTVSNILGPSISQLTRDETPLGIEETRRMAMQLTQCVAFLHSKDIGIAHGDLTTSNVLFEISSINHWPVEELNDHLGKIRVVRVFDEDGELNTTDFAPEYLVEPVNPMNLFALRTGNIKVIDFAESFNLDSPPENGVGTPFPFCSPELLVHKSAGKASDIWALACSILEMRAGEPLIMGMMGDEGEILSQMRSLFGPFPENLRDPEVNEDEVYDDSWTLKTRILGDEPMENVTTNGPYHLLPNHESFAEERRKIGWLARLKTWVWGFFSSWWTAALEYIRNARRTEEEQEEYQRKAAERRELKVLYDLLSGIFKYDIEERLKADQMLLHPWLSPDTNL